MRINNGVKKLEKPSLVLVTHGSFVDFFYAAAVTKKDKPHFITNRMYFYKKSLGKFIKDAGCIPKSIFTPDLETVKNCFRVIGYNEVLVMMPEARLSTVGQFEEIQDVTYKFIQNLIYRYMYLESTVTILSYRSGRRRCEGADSWNVI